MTKLTPTDESTMGTVTAEVEADPLDALVAKFSAQLLRKLKISRAKHGHQDETWMDPDWPEHLRDQIRHHLEKGDPLDVAAYCAFAWFHGWSLSSDTRFRCPACEGFGKSSFDKGPDHEGFYCPTCGGRGYVNGRG